VLLQRQRSCEVDRRMLPALRPEKSTSFVAARKRRRVDGAPLSRAASQPASVMGAVTSERCSQGVAFQSANVETSFGRPAAESPSRPRPLSRSLLSARCEQVGPQVAVEHSIVPSEPLEGHGGVALSLRPDCAPTRRPACRRSVARRRAGRTSRRLRAFLLNRRRCP